VRLIKTFLMNLNEMKNLVLRDLCFVNQKV